MYTEIQIRIKPEQAGVEETLRQIAARVAGVGAERICRVDIVRKSIDARQKEVMFNLVAGLHIDRIEEKEKVFVPAYRDVSDRETVGSFKFHTNRFADFEKNREDIRRGTKPRSTGRRSEDNDDRRGGGRDFKRGGDKDFKRGGGRDFKRGGDKDFKRGGKDFKRGGKRNFNDFTDED